MNIVEELYKKKIHCEKCDKYFNYKTLYNQHLISNLHTNNERKERSDKGIERKINKSNIKKNHICKICNYKTINIHNYENHILNNHSNIEEKENKFKYYCKVCNFGVFTKSSYEKHLETKKHYIKNQNI